MRFGLAAIGLATLSVSLSASAINQPRGGPQIPVGAELQTLFTQRGEAIRVREDAAIMPERFQPGCSLTFTLVGRANAAFRNIFGWYNVRPGVTPSADNPPRDLQVLIPCDATGGQRFTLNLRDNPAYQGGEIGFFLRTPEEGTTGRCQGDCCASLSRTGHTFFSERGYNPDSMGADSYIHLLIYDSRSQSRSFYFAWEDLYSGGDNNFTDFVAQVDEIVCTGAGAPCDTRQMGACAQGTLQCRNGALTCLAAVTAGPERCDGIDNNCDGMVDNGDGLCGAQQVCDRGSCVDRCMGELGCFPGLSCTERGTCVEAGCLSVSCAANERCQGGRCVGACEGVSCPRGLVCRAGRCVDGCANVRCDNDQVCVEGNCVPRCECRRCGDGQRCVAGRCVAAACATVSCAAGTVCVEGSCRDACEGAQCPGGEQCQAGQCVPVAPRDGGVRDSAIEVGVIDTGVIGANDLGSGVDADLDAGHDAGPAVVLPGNREGACGCRVSGSARGSRLGLVGFALWALGRRRRQGR
ncbi:MAG: DUF4114 domain-containing protein [Myxococcales bacterium]|nr:DUF4114 domain-containing protein [Myxococcales bacterium]